jgi:hypothetical protein
MTDNAELYQVGYGKPPKATRFKKGQSGNHLGRRKSAATIETILSQELKRQLEFNENGIRGRNSKLSLMIK